ncbi:MAG TPA: SDR family NAD(P)-dependent oxidoreductase, partial [Synergistaceae bacterium]|nr:SDR family NAD(P)-dependent oxidoreductase [Synergistaceae bacterium]
MQGKTAFITGGTGGIGEALVRSLAAAGASVGFIYRRNEAKAQELEKELSRENLLVRGFRADLGNYEEIAATIVSGASLFGGYDYL